MFATTRLVLAASFSLLLAGARTSAAASRPGPASPPDARTGLAYKAPCLDYGTTFHYVAGEPYNAPTYDLMAYTALAVKGRKAYAYQMYRGLVVIDILDLEDPVNQGVLPLPAGVACHDLACLDHFVLMASGALRVADVDDEHAPVLVHTLNTPGTAFGVRTRVRLAYVADGGAGLTVYDFDNPLEPEFLTTAATSGSARSLEVHGDLLLVGCEGGLDVFSLATPTSPELQGSLGLTGTVQAVDAEGDVALLEVDAGVALVDLSAPAAPALLSSGFEENSVAAVALRAGVAWIGGDREVYGGSLDRFSVANPFAPVRIGRSITNGWPEALAFAHDHLFTANAGDWMDWAETEGFHIYDPTYPESPPRIGLWVPSSYEFFYATGLLRGDLFYDCGQAAIGILDWSDPEDPYLRGTLHTGDLVQAAAYANGHLVVRHWRLQAPAWLQVYDVRNPDFVVPAGSLELPDGGTPYARDGRIYLTTAVGVQLYQVSDGGEMVLQGTVSPAEPLGLLVFEGDRVVALDAANNLRLFSVEDPLTFVPLGLLPPEPNRVRRPMAVAGDLICFEHPRPSGDWPWNGAWGIADMTDPEHPSVLCEVPLPFEEYFAGLVVIGDRVIVSGTTTNWVYDVSNPAAPVLEGQGPHSRADACELHLGSDFLLSHTRERGVVELWPLPCLNAAEVVNKTPRRTQGPTVVPNPFRLRAEIRFELPATGPVELSIFNLQGARVRELVRGKIAAGPRGATWDGCDYAGRPVAAGVYLARLRLAGRTTSVRLTLVR